jgi:hypothetical protein
MHREPPPALRPPVPPAVPRLALNCADAARALAISEPTLRGLSDLPRVRLGTRVLFRVSALEQWLAQRERSPADEANNQAESTDTNEPTATDAAG